MKQIDKTPIWVTLVYANVHTRKMALIMVIFCVIFALYCVPWVQFSANPIIAKLFLIDDWSWFLSMIPLIIWYWVALRWVDKTQAGNLNFTCPNAKRRCALDYPNAV